MTDEKWEELVGRIKDTFTIEEEFAEPLDDRPGTRRGVVFQSPQGKMKLEYCSTPVVLGTHTIGSKRIGGNTTVEYEYSQTDRRGSLTAYRWQNEAWAVVNAESLVGTLS